MKILSITTLLFLIIGTQAFASSGPQECNIDQMVYRKQLNDLKTGARTTVIVNSWEDCFQEALKLARANPAHYQKTGRFHSSQFAMRTYTGTLDHYVYFGWGFDSNIINLFNPRGSVSKFTEQYLGSSPRDTDARKMADGTDFPY